MNRLVIPAWFVALAGTAVLALGHGDPLPAGLLVMFGLVGTACRHRHRVGLTLGMSCGLILLGILVAGNPGLPGMVRRDALVLVFLAPPLALAVSGPFLLIRRRESSLPCGGEDQSSISSMSEDTGGGTLGMVTSVKKQSKAA